MKKASYAFSVVSYVHDPVAAERLNCALIFFAPSEGILRCLTSKNTKRLEATFGCFVAQHHQRVLSDLAARTEEARAGLDASHWGESQELSGILRMLLPDQGLSYQAGPVRFGLSANPLDEAESLFDRMVESQRVVSEPGERRRTDDVVWSTFRHAMKQREALRRAVHPVKLRGRNVEIEFKHAVKNGKYHVVQPLSFDVDRMLEKAANWVGKSVALEAAPELAQMFFLVGAPKDPTSQQSEAFDEAIGFLRSSVKVPHEIVMEAEAEELADRLVAIIGHGSDEG